MSDQPNGEWLPGLEQPEEVGRGGFGVVYSALQTDLGRTVAVKILSGQLDELALQRFDRERKAMGALSAHPNIVTIYSSGLTEDGRPFIVMEYLPGGSLGERLEESGPMAWEQAADAAVHLASALETAHRAGVLHRDLKPENVFVSSLGAPKMGDFGIARLEGAPQTQSAMLTASVAHASPELVEGQPPSVQSDVYGLASTVMTLLTGSPPFTRPTDQSIVPILNRIVNEAVPDLRDQGVPGPVCDALEQALAKDPGERFSSAEAFGRALQAAQRRAGVGETPLLIQGADRTVPRGSGAPSAPTDPGVAPPPPPKKAPPGSVTIITGETPVAPERDAPAPPPAAAPPPPPPAAPAPGVVSGDQPPPPPPPPAAAPAPPPAAAPPPPPPAAPAPGVVSGDQPPPGPAPPPAPPPRAPAPGVVSGDQSPPPPPPSDTTGKKWLVGLVVAIAVVLILIVLGVASGRGRRNNKAADSTTTIEDTTSTTGDVTDATTEIPFDLGDDPALDDLTHSCAAGDLGDCDALYFQSPLGTNYESFGDTCGGREDPGNAGHCAD